MKTARALAFLAVAVCVVWGGAAGAAEVVTHPFDGVTLIDRTEASPRPVSIHIVEIDLADPGIRFKVTPASGSRDTVRQTTLDYLNQEDAQVAINCHFFLPVSSETNVYVGGLAASQGNVYSPFEGHPFTAGYTDQSYAILPFAPALNIDAANHAGIVYRDSTYADNKHVLEPVTLWNAVSGSAQIITNGAKTIPTYSPTGELNLLNGYSNDNSWYALPRARTAIGLTQDNQTLVLFTVDAAGGSGGMSPGEVADMLIADYHVYNALNLDGGGSTTLAMENPVTNVGSVLNVSADNPLGRAVGSNLAVFATPEPATMAMLGIGLPLLLRLRKRGGRA